ncbi:hypothetical protein CPB83DRAFT_851268 [Crepidotus variabilis]|uniref:Uncharacterized protein n=1 Tax=Crepidotus variabilis TaxID=179855 RepID=A0A9P6EK16_9AGAR|nr:hypothetical protein CPB83DRAFT_851268 [Crepidotus variabilis]
MISNLLKATEAHVQRKVIEKQVQTMSSKRRVCEELQLVLVESLDGVIENLGWFVIIVKWC